MAPEGFVTLLEKILGQAATDLAAAEIEFALVGGLAVSVRTEPRFTRDVDLVVTIKGDREAESLVYFLQNRGYSVQATMEQEAVGRLATGRPRDTVSRPCSMHQTHSEPESKSQSTSWDPLVSRGRFFEYLSIFGGWRRLGIAKDSPHPMAISGVRKNDISSAEGLPILLH